MRRADWTSERPEEGETETDFCRRLEARGFDEMTLRKALRAHFSMDITEFGRFFEGFPEARLREIAKMRSLRGADDDNALLRRISRSFGIPMERARYWLALSRQASE